MAVILPHAEHLRQALESKAIPGVDAKAPLNELCHSKAVAELVLKECNALGKKNGFKQMELLQAVVLTPDEWTPESGLVTAAQKVQRKKVAEAFKDEIKVRARSVSSPPRMIGTRLTFFASPIVFAGGVQARVRERVPYPPAAASDHQDCLVVISARTFVCVYSLPPIYSIFCLLSICTVRSYHLYDNTIFGHTGSGPPPGCAHSHTRRWMHICMTTLFSSQFDRQTVRRAPDICR